jgi:protein-disulfide isomerase
MSDNDKQGTRDRGMTRKQRRAAERAARKGGPRPASAAPARERPGTPILLVSAGAIVIGLVAVVILVAVSGGLGGDDVAAVSEPDTPAPAAELHQGRTLVAPDAVEPVVVEAFEDPQCIHCGNFTARIEPLIVGGPVADGVASFTYKDFVIFGEESLDAAVAQRVAEDMDGKFWEFHHVLFHNQAGVEDGSFTRDRLADMAVLVGLDRDEFLERMDDPVYREAVAAEGQEGASLGVSSTPSVFVNGERLEGSVTWESLRDAIEAASAGG